MSTQEEHPDKEKKHHTWIDTLKDDIMKLNTDFPLSGGEEPLTPAQGEGDDDVLPDIDLTAGEDTEFPLSGGEKED